MRTPYAPALTPSRRHADSLGPVELRPGYAGGAAVRPRHLRPLGRSRNILGSVPLASCCTAARERLAAPGQEGSMTTVAIFGGTGYAGSAIRDEALRRGHQVISVTRSGAPDGAPDGNPERAPETPDL